MAFILDILDGFIKKIANSFILSDFSFLIRILDDKQIDYSPMFSYFRFEKVFLSLWSGFSKK